ncbi:MAG: 2,3-bisphosphoglycerate-dependent phosphoglycerate mutase [Candidatus Micrarchaeota archaeon]
MNYSGLIIDKWGQVPISGSSRAPTIYLFRHAQTNYNKNRWFTGWKDSKLTPFGKRQARKVAEKLKGKKFEIAVHTRLSRSIDTLNAVLKFHPECRHVFTDDRMIERNYGDFSGSSHKIYAAKYGEEKLHILRRSYDNVPPNGESVKMVEKRVYEFMDELLPWMERNKVNVAISGHGNSMRPFRRRLEHLTIGEMMKLENPWDDYFEYRV